MTDDKKPPIDLGLDYHEALHGVQCAIGYHGEKDQKVKEFKHLRTGIDSAHITNAAVARLLIAKGIFTEEEYREAVRLAANDELAGYERMYPPIKFR